MKKIINLTRGQMAAPLKNQSGIVLLAALVLMLLLAALGVGIIIFTSTDVKIARNTTLSTQSFMGAEGGIADAINTLRDDPNWGPDLDGDGDTADDAAAWQTASTGTFPLGDLTGSYTITLYDSTGSNGRENNSLRTDKYVALGTNDILVEVTASVGGIERSIGLVVRSKVEAFDYVLFSEGTISGNGVGSSPGKIVNKLYGNTEINVQGNYGLDLAEAQSTTKISPNCNSGKYLTCDDSHDPIDAPELDFSYYQTQGNFSDQQVFTMTPTVGGSNACGAGCDETWTTFFGMQTLGTSYTISAFSSATSGLTTVSWCADPTWVPDANADQVADLCPDASTPNTYAYQNTYEGKPFINAAQFNAYTAPTAPYTSSIVNVFDATKHLEFMGPPTGQSVTLTQTILVGTAADNSSPSGKIDFYGDGGTLNLMPANDLAVVSETIKFKSKYGDFHINVGTTGDGAIMVASKDFKVEGKDGECAEAFNEYGGDMTEFAMNRDSIFRYTLGNLPVASLFFPDEAMAKKDDEDDDEDDDDDKDKDDDDDKGGGGGPGCKNSLTLDYYGSIVVGGDSVDGDDDSDHSAEIDFKGQNNTLLNFTYVEPSTMPSGWSDFGSMLFEKREWREL